MSDNVIPFQKREPFSVIWVCNCGCESHYHHENGDIFCAACDTQGSPASGDWRARLPPAEPELAPVTGENFTVFNMDSAEIFMKRELRSNRTQEALLAAVLYEDGLQIWTQGEASHLQKWALKHARLFLNSRGTTEE